MKTELLNNQHLIQEFMGVDKTKRLVPYHSCWNHLMSVVEKIDKYLEDNMGKVGYFDDCLLSNDIDVRYQAVVEFIEYYNQNK